MLYYRSEVLYWSIGSLSYFFFWSICFHTRLINHLFYIYFYLLLFLITIYYVLLLLFVLLLILLLLF